MAGKTPFLAVLALCLPLGVAVAQETNSEQVENDRMDEPTSSSGPAVRFSVNAGFDFNTGDFGADDDTTTISTPVSVRADVGNFRFSVSGAWVQIEGPGGVTAGGVILDDGGVPDDGDAVIETNSGFGDLTLGVNYDIPTSVTGDWLVQLQARLKVPTANADAGLGTGEVDFGFNADIARSFGSFTPFTTVGYRFRGSPEGTTLNDTFSVSVGGAYAFSNGVALLGSYDFRQATTDGAPSSSELFGAVSGRFTDNVRWTLYGSGGLSDGAPDVGAGFQISLRM